MSVRVHVRSIPATVVRATERAAGRATDSPTAGFEEIVVTAQKRPENIRDVPISITALTSNELAKTGVTNIAELTAAVPGLRMDRVEAIILIAIPGISTFPPNAGIE